MSKSAKRKGKVQEEKRKAKRKAVSKGRLVALDGTKGHELEQGAERLVHLLSRTNGDAGWSRWDASNTFYELRLGKSKHHAPPPRTLLLLYASDLLFRLRWEIRPALAEGHTVVAAPYLETAIGFGVASGLSLDWLQGLFSFAPKADASFRLKESKKFKEKVKGKKAPSGFVEFCFNRLAAAYPNWNTHEVFTGMRNYLDTLEENEEIRRLGKKLPKSLSKVSSE
jgi:thymidylate kinase